MRSIKVCFAMLMLWAAPAAAQTKAHKEALSDPMLYMPPDAAGVYAINTHVEHVVELESGGVAVPESLSDSKILFVAHIANVGEVAAAKLARERAQDVRVRRLAGRILLQHERADRHAEELIKRRNLDMTSTPTGVELQSDEQQVLAELQTKFGADFDRAYLAAQVDDHRRVLELIDDKLMPNAADRDVQTLVRELRPTVQGHLAKLQALQLKVKE